MTDKSQESAIVALLTELQMPLRLYVNSLLPGDPSAKDVTQQANATIWKKRLDFTPGSNFKAWAFSIARFEVLNYRKRLAKEARLHFSEDLEQTFATEMSEFAEDWDSRMQALGEITEGYGSVVAAREANNRWGRPQEALDFSPAGSRVRLSVTDPLHSLTLLCWVKINSLDRWYNSLFLTDGHELNEPHWQIMDDGRLFFSVKKNDRWDRSRGIMDKHIFYSPQFWDPSLSGQWLMLATTYDIEKRQVTHLLNGKKLSQERIPDEYLVETVRIGNASLGNWGLPERDDPKFAVRNLNGSMDEFALFNTALSAEEIYEIYANGKP